MTHHFEAEITPGNKVRIFGTECAFLQSLRNHPRFQNRFNPLTGIAVSDCDVLVYNYKCDGSNELPCVQFIEVKSRLSRPDFAQTQLYKALDSFKGVKQKDRLIFYGVSFVSYEGCDWPPTGTIQWGRFRRGEIAWKSVGVEKMWNLVTMIDNPDSMQPRRPTKAHHRKWYEYKSVPTQLGFSVNAKVVNAY